MQILTVLKLLAEYENNDFKKVVELKVLTVKSNTDLKNVGVILEKYRSLISEAEKYYEDNQLTLEAFVTKHTLIFDNFSPECTICIFPSNKNRKKLLTSFKNKITSSYTNHIIDYSDKFLKKDPSKSIKVDNLTKDDFELSLDLQKPIKELLIIDDVIDEGKTLNILLDKLFDEKLINNDTVIRMACIYNRPKANKVNVNPLQAYKDNINKQNKKLGH